MAITRVKPIVTCEISLTLTEPEARALLAICGYGEDAFLKTFYAEMGESYLKPHEKGFRALCKSVAALSGPMEKADEARRLLNNEEVFGEIAR